MSGGKRRKPWGQTQQGKKRGVPIVYGKKRAPCRTRVGTVKRNYFSSVPKLKRLKLETMQGEAVEVEKRAGTEEERRKPESVREEKKR